jgi:DNA-binding NarL/FixJ family response regulator/signal transduction histidine kinase
VTPRRLDALIAGALFAGLTAETLTSSHLHGPVALNVLASAGASLPFAWRRSYPVPVVAVVITSAGLEAAFLTDFTDLTTALVVPLLAAYTLGEQLERRASYVALAATYVGAMAVEVIDHGLRANDVVLIAFYLLAAWFVGRSLRARNALNVALREKTLRLDAEREETARAEVRAERARVARELHDVVAHGVSVMVVQAGGARRMVRADPERAREALDAVEASGRQALDELRRLVGVMRPGDAEADRAPAPGLDRLDDLVTRAREAGLPVEVHVAGAPTRLTAGLDLAAYRVIQEALTNTIKHAGAAQADVTIRYAPDAVELEVADDGHGEGEALPAGGHGLVGMRERVSMYGGELETGARGRRLRGACEAAAVSAVRVLLADDQALVRAGFRMILDAEEDIEVEGEAKDGAEAVRAARELRPDVVLMDIRMPNLDGLEATRQVMAERAGEVRLLILTTFDLNEYVYEALRSGASGFLLKDAPAESLIAGIRVVADGEALLAPSITRRLIEEFARGGGPAAPPPGLDELTPRELDVFKQVARGLSNAEIAGELIVSETTVKTHVARMLMKLGLRDRVQAVVLAYEAGIVTPGAEA